MTGSNKRFCFSIDGQNDSKLNVLEAGSYTITIHAQDLNGNSAEKKVYGNGREKKKEPELKEKKSFFF